MWSLITIGFLGAATYHAIAIFAPAIARGGSPGRHAAFAIVDAAMSLGLAYRPRWFTVVFAVLAGQAVQGHGGYAWRVWEAEGRVSWIDWGVTVVVLGVLALLVHDAMASRRAAAGGQAAEPPPTRAAVP